MQARTKILAAALAVFSASAPAHEPGAHVHGAARLDAVVDGGTLTLSLESPLDSLLGFEHMPRTEKQRAAVRAMAEKLAKTEKLFVPSPAAQCVPQAAKLESPLLEAGNQDAKAGHLDIAGEYVFRCARPEALRDIEVRLFEPFPRLRRLDVQAATPHGQAAARLTPSKRRIAW